VARQVLVSLQPDPANPGGWLLVRGPASRPVEESQLLSRDYSEEQVIQNLRLAKQIGGYGSPASREFIDAVNKAAGGNNGIECRDAQRWLHAVTLIDPAGPTYEVALKDKPNVPVPSYTITVLADQLDAPYADDEDARLLENLASFFRVSGVTRVDAAAAAQVTNRPFWV
jgi:hypothetical protein